MDGNSTEERLARIETILDTLQRRLEPLLVIAERMVNSAGFKLTGLRKMGK